MRVPKKYLFLLVAFAMVIVCGPLETDAKLGIVDDLIEGKMNEFEKGNKGAKTDCTDLLRELTKPQEDILIVEAKLQGKNAENYDFTEESQEIETTIAILSRKFTQEVDLSAEAKHKALRVVKKRLGAFQEWYAAKQVDITKADPKTQSTTDMPGTSTDHLKQTIPKIIVPKIQINTAPDPGKASEKVSTVMKENKERTKASELAQKLHFLLSTIWPCLNLSLPPHRPQRAMAQW